jgi:hypothetical protein
MQTHTTTPAPPQPTHTQRAAHLVAQLARGHEHDRLPGRPAAAGAGHDALQRRQQVGQRLAAACARARDDVLALQGGGDGGRLHGRGLRQALLGERAQDAVVQARGLEGAGHNGVRLLLCSQR